METPIEKKSESGDRKKFISSLPVHLVLIIFFGLLAYSNSFHVPFHFDDHVDITGQGSKDFSFLTKADLSFFFEPSKASQLKLDPLVHRYLRTRTIGFMTLWVNYRLGGLNVVGYHIVNLAIHIVNGLLLYALLTFILRTPLMRNSSLKGHAHLFALFVGVLFVTHPVQTEAVTYISKRLTSLVTMFYLLSIVLYVASRLSSKRISGMGFYALSFLSVVLAMKTKEIAFTLPVAIAVCEFIFFKESVKRRILNLFPFLITMMIIPHAVITSSGGVSAAFREGTRLLTDMPREAYLITQFRAIITYMRLLFFPINQTVDYDYPSYYSLLEAPAAISLLILIGILFLSVYLLLRSRARAELGLLSFGIIWFFLSSSVESSVIPLKETFVEYRAYLPNAGGLIALVTAGFIAMEFIGKKKSTLAVIFFLVILLFSGTTFARNVVWQSDLQLWSDAISKSPQKGRGYANLGVAYFSRGKIDLAIENLETALQIQQRKPGSAENYFNLGNAYRLKGRLDDAIKQYQIAVDLFPEFVQAYSNMALTYKSKGLNNKAIENFQKTIELNPYYVGALNNLGAIYRSEGKMEKAIIYFEKALKLSPDNAIIHLNLSAAYRALGQIGKAAEHRRIAQKLGAR
jgi:tetratricopeptide (TPR) repeat protein